MLLNRLMEGEANNLFGSSKKFKTDEKKQDSISALLKKNITPENDRMAIKENQSNSDKYVYTIPIKPPISPANERTKLINEAKLAFLNSTVNSSPLPKSVTKKVEPTIHYAQLAIARGSEDTRSTGGGICTQQRTNLEYKEITTVPLGISHNTKKKMEQQQRKVSFKIKSASNSYKRPPLATKTMTITSSNVSELTKKFNNLVTDNNSGPMKQSKLAKTIEDLQMVSRCSASNSSTPSSTLSSSPNIKIVVRQRRGSKKRNNKKRCSSMDSIDKLLLSDNSSAKFRVIRSKSDGTKIPKSPKKRLKFQDANKDHSGSDTVDGSPDKTKGNTPIEMPQSNVVKNVIKKFECEITAQCNTNALKRQNDQTKSTIPAKEKPKVPEKKSSLVLTKNLVVKDGIPKIKTIKSTQQTAVNNMPISTKDDNKNLILDLAKKKEPLYDKKKFKTNYIHSEKLPLKVVEIIQEDIDKNSSNSNSLQETILTKSKEEDKIYEAFNSNITPNQSFLWRRKSSTYSDIEKSPADGSYSFVNVTNNDIEINTTEQTQEISTVQDESQKLESHETIKETNVKWDPYSDFETNLVEAFNKEVLVGYTAKPKKDLVLENDYELLEPKDIPNVVVIPVKCIEKPSKINCPLPDIPQIDKPNSSTETQLNEPGETEDNIYQCLLELRSHPEGDESSIHNYELCDNKLEERTRGDGDSDDGYEYCKSPIKPYCLTSSSGIQIAENYQPSPASSNSKNYAISKSVSGTSTVSYERIGPERIYEKIPIQPSISKDSSPTYSGPLSFVSTDYTGYNESENIYDTIKHSDATSLSHCYESIPNSPSMVKVRTNIKKQLSSSIHKRLSFDNMSTNSHCTISSEQKTNSIYGQRSVLSYNGQEIAFQVPSSDTSVSDRSDDWVDISDEEKTEEQKIIIVQEISRGRKSPVSWSQKVRHQWQKSPEQENERKDCDSSDSGHLYESLEPLAQASGPHPPIPFEDDFDSFDSDTDDDHDAHKYAQAPPSLPASRLPSPPTERGQYTLTKIASAAQRKMREIKRNLTKRYNVAMDVKSLNKSPLNNQNATYDTNKKTKSPIYANCEKPEIQHVYSNVNFNDTQPTRVLNKTENSVTKVNGNFKDELKTVVGEKRLSNGDVPPPLPDKPPPEKPTTPTSENSKKDNGTLSRKTYFSFKSRFRRASSLAVDINTEVPSALKITNSTFYLTDSMDGDSGFSNCSDNGQPGSTETLSPNGAARRRDGRARPWAESSPCLALERPAVPPPPPPGPHALTDLSAVNEELKRLLPTLSRKDKGPRTRTSWYAGCGADTPSVNNSTASWYAEAGLYQAGNISTSSGASSGSHPASPLPHSLFTHEPLYQFYNAAKVESVCRETGDSDSDVYEANAGAGAEAGAGAGALADSTIGPDPAASTGVAPPARPSAMALVAPRGPARTLWCEVPEVVNSAVLSSLAPAQKRLQEAKFELLTSEASYLNSLNVLEAHFIAHPAFRDTHVLPAEDFETLFSTILPVRKCSQLLMNELEKCWQENILLQGICDIVRRHADEHFHVYVKYCENQTLMVKALQRLREQTAFSATLKKLESHPACQSLSLHSFLMLPMQRVTRLPLLLDAVLKHLDAEDGEYQSCMLALATLNNYVSQCNEGARNTERVEEMFRVSRSVSFAPHVRQPPQLAPACARRDRRPVRWLVRSGEMTQMVWKSDESKLTFGKKFHKVPLYLFLFNDLLVITKKKGEESYLGIDHCPRSLLEVSCGEGATAAKHSLLLTLLENHEGRTVEMLVACPSETAARRWAEALLPAPAAPGEALYAGWDCPQVAALYAYAPAQPDELALAEGDVVNVTRKTSEGWYYGERTRDGESGWFPGAYTAEIASAHVRARHLRQRYRLLALSSSYGGHGRRLK